MLASCDSDEPMPCSNPNESNSTLNLRFTPEWNGEQIEAGSEFEDHLGNRLRLFNFKTFIAEIKVELQFDVPNSESFTKLEFSTGVPAEYNVDYDPSTWPNAHPLSVQGAQGMHWAWNTGYVFTKFDGKADTTDAAEPTYLYPFTFHCGDDTFYTGHAFDIEISSGIESSHTLDIKLHTETILNSSHSIDIREDGETHTGGDFELASEFIENFNSTIELE